MSETYATIGVVPVTTYDELGLPNGMVTRDGWRPTETSRVGQTVRYEDHEFEVVWDGASRDYLLSPNFRRTQRHGHRAAGEEGNVGRTHERAA